MRANHRLRSGFTLTEMLIAVAVLVGVLLASSRIFSTTSKVAGMGEANADVLQAAAAIEQALRDDVARMTSEGVLAIRNVAVRNDKNGAVLLDPSKPRDALIRADQMVFFTSGLDGFTTYRVGRGDNHRGQATAARIYFGHAFRLGDASLPASRANGQNRWSGHDPSPAVGDYASIDANDLAVPWIDTASTSGATLPAYFAYYDGPGIFTNAASADPLRVPRTDARQWLLVREAILLADDDYLPPGDIGKTVYLDEVTTLKSIFLDDPVTGANLPVLAGRVDGAALDLSDVRNRIVYTWSGSLFDTVRLWSRGPGIADPSPIDQFGVIANNLLFYPRAERYAPSMHRVDQALTNGVIGVGCSSVRIDWTWDEGTGARAGFDGVDFRNDRPQAWFGLRDPARLVFPYGDQAIPNPYDDWWTVAETIFPQNVERWNPNASLADAVRTYEAVFGFNRTDALDANGQPTRNLGFTPWPRAIRVTLVLHDSRTVLENGREVQFVIDLPTWTQGG